MVLRTGLSGASSPNRQRLLSSSYAGLNFPSAASGAVPVGRFAPILQGSTRPAPGNYAGGATTTTTTTAANYFYSTSHKRYQLPNTAIGPEIGSSHNTPRLGLRSSVLGRRRTLTATSSLLLSSPALHARSRSLFSRSSSPSLSADSQGLRQRNGSCAPFSSSSRNMVATKIDGTAIAKKIRDGLRTEIDDKRKTNPRYQPSLKIIQGMQHHPMASVCF